MNRHISHEWECTDDDILQYIRKLNNNASVGCDGISPKFLKNCAVEIAPALAAIMNKCLYEGTFPSCWKQARITPIPKVPGTNLVNEYRPISVLPVISKIAEQWFKKLLSPYIMENVDSNQFAYTTGRSTEDALNLLQYYVTCGFSACPNTTKVAIVSFDVCKAFDQVQKNTVGTVDQQVQKTTVGTVDQL
ncbi:MAG: hypothetical protein GY696_39270 [Gammaproteobacteria bacterium]|nr:hypothetical protein [Gammaproteobacteria bacterium]